MIKGIKGVKDTLPQEMIRWQVIEGAARRQASLFGFQEMRIPIFEVTELFARSIGASTDIVEKEMYTFPDRDGTSLTLRPEGTAGAVRAYVEHNLAKTTPTQKWFYLGPMFRHERPQAGRLRQFHQLGVESFGSADPRADVEVIALLWTFLHDLRLPGLTLEINSLGNLEDRKTYKIILVKFLSSRKEALCGNCLRRIETNPLRVLDCKVPTCQEATKDAPQLTEHLSPQAKSHFEEVLHGLRELDIPYLLNPRLVRGLDYYTLTAFEVTSNHLGAQNAVGAGGRYDGLVEVLGGPSIPAVGFAVGLERVSLMLPEERVPLSTSKVYLAAFGKEGVSRGFSLLHQLRLAGIQTETDFHATTLKSHLRQADKRGATFALILGDDEVFSNSLTLRNLSTKEQENITLSSVVDLLTDRILTP